MSDIATLNIQGDRADGSHFVFDIHIPRAEIAHVAEILQDRAYEFFAIRRHQGPRIVVDIGAHVGLFAIFVKIRDPEAIIHCFEPCPSTFTLLEKNVAHVPGVYLHQMALGADDAAALLSIHPDNSGENSLRECSGARESVTVSVRHAYAMLQELGLQQIDVLKIDTEGCEVPILQTLAPMLDQIDFVLAEYHREWDRRAIDALLTNFYLFGLKADVYALGVVKYLHRALAERELNPARLREYDFCL